MEQIKTKTMAEIYLKQGHLQEAYEIFKVLAERDPANQEIGEKLGLLSQKLGLAVSSTSPRARSKEKTLQALEKWLANIQIGRMK